MHRSHNTHGVSVVFNSKEVDVDVHKVLPCYSSSSSSSSCSEVVTGKRGKKGEDGAKGAKGDKGEKGDTGPEGTFGGVVDRDILPYKSSVISIGNAGLDFKRVHCESVYITGPSLFIQGVPIDVKNSTINLPLGSTINNKLIGEKGHEHDFLVSIKNKDLSNNCYLLPVVDDVHIYTIDDSFDFSRNSVLSRNNIQNKNYVKFLANYSRGLVPNELFLYEEDVSTMIHTKSNGAYKQY